MRKSSGIGVPSALLAIALPIVGFLAGWKRGNGAKHMEEALQGVAIVWAFCFGGLVAGVIAAIKGGTRIERVAGVVGAVLSAVPVLYILFVV